jgi:hypothetical protein
VWAPDQISDLAAAQESRLPAHTGGVCRVSADG